MKKLLVAIFLLYLTSCATIINKRTYPLRINTNAQNATAKVYDSVYKLPADVQVTRSSKKLPVILNYDTITKVYIAKSKLMSKSSLSNLIFGGLYPEALVVDLLTKKGYYYGDELFLDIHDTIMEAKSIVLRSTNYVPNPKNSFNIDISIPYANGFLLQPENNGIKRGFGFFGISGGAEYFYKENKFVKLNTGGIINFPIPLPAAIINDGDTQSFSSVYTTLTDNYQLNRFNLGYGLSFSANRWHYNYGDDNYTNQKDKTERSRNLGLSFNGYYRLGKAFHVGFIYSPTFVSVYPQTELLYQHTISFDLLWKIRIGQ